MIDWLISLTPTINALARLGFATLGCVLIARAIARKERDDTALTQGLLAFIVVGVLD